MDNWTPEQLQEHLDEGKSVFLKSWKPGCGACKLSKPATERLEAKHGDKVLFGQIDTAEHEQMLEIADTDVLPVFFLFKDKKMAGKHIGFKGLQKLQEWMEGSI